MKGEKRILLFINFISQDPIPLIRFIQQPRSTVSDGVWNTFSAIGTECYNRRHVCALRCALYKLRSREGRCSRHLQWKGSTKWNVWSIRLHCLTVYQQWMAVTSLSNILLTSEYCCNMPSQRKSVLLNLMNSKELVVVWSWSTLILFNVN
jgi:hypothetical protein